jgi:hypothetical protein
MNHFARAHQNKKPSTDKKILFWLLLALAALTFFAAPLVMRSQEISNTYHVSQFAGPDVGTKLTNAQASCSPNTSIPCSIVIDAILAVWPQGTPPARCTQCIWFDYRAATFSATPSSATLPGVHIQVFNTSNSGFVIPAANMDCTVIGGGGGGGGSSATTINGGGGGSGSWAEKALIGLTPGLTLNMQVGAGGGGGLSGGGNGATGAGSVISSGSQTITPIFTNGGIGGGSVGTISGGGSGGAASTGGDMNYPGVAGTPALIATISGQGASSQLGGGGAVAGSGAGLSAAANTGSGGGGAGSGTAGNGGAGGSGVIFCKWVQ